MSRRPIGEAHVAALLDDLRGRVEFPTTPDLVPAVTDTLSGETQPQLPAGPARRWFARPAFAIPVVIAAALAASLVLSAPARRAVADLLGVVGIEIEFGALDEQVTPAPRLTTVPELGQPVSIDAAEAAVGFEVRGSEATGGAREIYLDRSIGNKGMVSTVFGSKDGDIVYLVSEFEAEVSADFIKKVVPEDGVRVRYPTVAGEQAYWIEGAPHFFSYIDPDGVLREESVRLARNVLVWSSGGITYRIEGAESLRRALEMAANMGF